MTKLTAKNVLITAGAQGIGEAISKHLIDNGANVAIHYFSSMFVLVIKCPQGAYML